MKPPFGDAPPQVVVDELEKSILEYWRVEDIFARTLKAREGATPFVFYDGPPYATGKPHYGHVLQSALKDTVLRYKTMRGLYAPRRVGWDTHGLPVEVLVEKELGLKAKKDIEAFGIKEFNDQCRAAVFRYIEEFTATLQRLGRWADYENGYATLDRDYMAAEWGAFKALWDKELVYKDYRSTPYCIRCATPLSNFETSMGYKDKTDKAVYVLLKVNSEDLSRKTSPGGEATGLHKQLSLLVWTTTPWTLPANVAIAFNPAIEYVSVLDGDKQIILAKDRVKAAFNEEKVIERSWTGEQLRGMSYEPLYKTGDATVESNELYRVVEADFVTTDEGTGLVHIAPAFGTEDHALARQLALPVLRTVDTNGLFYKDVPRWGGKHIWKANKEIIADLDERKLLVKQENYTHSYPHCWRCDQPLIYYALDSWFVRVTDLKPRLLAHNEAIRWIPSHIKHGRFAKGIESAPDWAVSRNRFWSTPLPVWECEQCEARVCIGSVEELQELSGASDAAVADLHRPYVDEITWPHSAEASRGKSCSGTMRRVPEVLDVWFDAAAMPYAAPQQGFPADFIAESIEMTRAWFYVLHVLAVALKDSPAYRNVIGSGIIFGEDGNKLSKKLKNYPEVEPTLAKFGADTVRLFFLTSTLGEPYVFSEKELQHLHRSFYGTLWNVYSFFVRYANTHDWQRPTKNSEFRIENLENILDRWILARLAQLEHEVVTSMDQYRTDNAARAFIPFVDDLSNWYVRRSRSRFHPSTSSGQGPSPDEAFATLYAVLVRLTKLMAPFMPFVTEEMYRNLTGETSVHMADLELRAELASADQELLAAMAAAREVVSAGLADRAKKGIKVRQPLQRLYVERAAPALSDELKAIICDEVNVKEIVVDPSLPSVAMVDGEITPELKQEGLAREIVRQGQALRREAEYALDERIKLVFVSDSPELAEVWNTHRDTILSALQADEVLTERRPADAEADIKIQGETVYLGVLRQL